MKCNISNDLQDNPAQTLSTCPTGAVVLVSQIAAPEHDAIRLKRMGICEGRRVQLIQAGDPLILRVVGCRIGLSQRLATQIQVQPCSECS